MSRPLGCDRRKPNDGAKGLFLRDAGAPASRPSHVRVWPHSACPGHLSDSARPTRSVIHQDRRTASNRPCGGLLGQIFGVGACRRYSKNAGGGGEDQNARSHGCYHRLNHADVLAPDADAGKIAHRTMAGAKSRAPRKAGCSLMLLLGDETVGLQPIQDLVGPEAFEPVQ